MEENKFWRGNDHCDSIKCIMCLLITFPVVLITFSQMAVKCIFKCVCVCKYALWFTVGCTLSCMLLYLYLSSVFDSILGVKLNIGLTLLNFITLYHCLWSSLTIIIYYYLTTHNHSTPDRLSFIIYHLSFIIYH